MSNWSTVILSWSAVDDQAENFGSHRVRLEDIDRKYQDASGRGGGWVYVPPCPEDGSPGGAGEVVAVTHINHFVPDELLAAARSFSWEVPEEVQVLWKDEEMEGYEAATLIGGAT